MTKRDIEGLKVGDQLRIKRGYDNSRSLVEFVGHAGEEKIGGKVVHFIEIIQSGQRRIASADQFTIPK